jgi:hypothetical protein
LGISRGYAGGVRIVGCYFPQSYAKAPFLHQCIKRASDNRDVPLVIIGDFNTGRNDLDIEGRGTRFHCNGLIEDWYGQELGYDYGCA